jgi:hypothetical protein
MRASTKGSGNAMNKLADYFKTSGMRLGVFYPTII